MLTRLLSRKLFAALLLTFGIVFTVLQLIRVPPSHGHKLADSRTAVRPNNHYNDLLQSEGGQKDQSLLENVNSLLEQGGLNFYAESDSAAIWNDDSDINVNEGSDDKHRKPRQFDYREIFSLTTLNRKYIQMFLGTTSGYNANLIPHPSKTDFWIVVVQSLQSVNLSPSEQLVCTVGILNDVFVCTEDPKLVPIFSVADGHCEGDMESLHLVSGPRDARLFYGPDFPYITFGAQSQYTCIGQWLQDARILLDEFAMHRYTQMPLFAGATELRRSADYRPVEKNYFLFWDTEGRAYAHYNLFPRRSFAQLNFDGSGISDLAPVSAYDDQVCMARFMPSLVSEFESIHQATNSLWITLCKRADPMCIPTDSNTFVMHVFQLKSYYDFHSIYEPFVVLFKRSAPFALHAISQRPLWIHGRNNLTATSNSHRYQTIPEQIPLGHTEMFYVTSMSWKSHSQRYHGYMDDPLFLTFGIEDTRPGAIDVLAEDLLQDLAYC